MEQHSPFVPAARARTHRRADTRMLACQWAERCHSVPSPHVGEGQGGGYNKATARVSDPRLNHRTLDISNLHRICFAPSALSPPLSLSLPHMGGGNRVARTFE